MTGRPDNEEAPVTPTEEDLRGRLLQIPAEFVALRRMLKEKQIEPAKAELLGRILESEARAIEAALSTFSPRPSLVERLLRDIEAAK